MKFHHELDMNDPADRKEMNFRVFGNVEGVERGPLSDYNLRNGKVHYDRIQQHLRAIEQYGPTGTGTAKEGYKEDADRERARINSILRSAGKTTV